MIEEFRDLFFNKYEIARKRKDQAQKVIGWVCTYVPEEIIYAGGMLPFRILGSQSPTHLAEAYLYSNNCTFVRGCLEEALNHNLNFLDGFVTGNTCDHIRRLYDVWMKYIGTPYTKIISIPCKVSEVTIKYFTQQLLHFKNELGGLAGEEISEEKLWGAIEEYNHSRDLLERLYAQRKGPSSPISGGEVAEVVRAASIIPRNEYNRLLEDLLKKVSSREVSSKDSRYRVLIVGSQLDKPEYIQLIEDLGGSVVTDDLCCGSRYFRGLIEKEEGDPLRAIAKRYLTRPFCARMHPVPVRVEYLKKMVQESNVEGVIYEVIKFCDVHASSYPMIRDGYDQLGIPVLYMEREYVMAGHGQIKTRVSAFFESLEARREQR